MSDTLRQRQFEALQKATSIALGAPEGIEHYSDEFIIPASDEKGASDRCQFRCAPRLHAWMEDVVQSKKFPFRRDGDLMRYGLYLACRALSQVHPDVGSLQGAVDAANAFVRRRELAAQIEEHLEKVGGLVNDLFKKKAWGEIVSVLTDNRRAALASVKTEPYWAQVWLDGLTARFEHIETAALSHLDTGWQKPGKEAGE